jgi:hypothetical protein
MVSLLISKRGVSIFRSFWAIQPGFKFPFASFKFRLARKRLRISWLEDPEE